MSAPTMADPAPCHRCIPFQFSVMLVERSQISSTLPGIEIIFTLDSSVSVPQSFGSGVVGAQNLPTSHGPEDPAASFAPALPDAIGLTGPTETWLLPKPLPLA